MVLTSLADSAARRVEALGSSLSETFLEPSLRLGVTGLARAGKIAFITTLVGNLMYRGRMEQLSTARDGRLETGYM